MRRLWAHDQGWPRRLSLRALSKVAEGADRHETSLKKEEASCLSSSSGREALGEVKASKGLRDKGGSDPAE